MRASPSEPSIYKHKGLMRLWKAFICSLSGLAYAMQEAAFRLEVIIGSVLVVLACVLSISSTQRLLLIGCVLLVLIVEILNSAIEAVVDDISLERRPLAKRAKDMGSAAVCLALLNAAACWGVVLWS